jgi:hypothetical protein
VRIDFTSSVVKPHVLKLEQLFRSRLAGLLGTIVGDARKADELRSAFDITARDPKGLLQVVLEIYQAYFQHLSPRVPRVAAVNGSKPVRYRRSA